MCVCVCVTCRHIHNIHLATSLLVQTSLCKDTHSVRRLRSFLPKFSYFHHAVTFWRKSPWFSWTENILHYYQFLYKFIWCYLNIHVVILLFQSFPAGFYISIWCFHELVVLFCSLRHQCTSDVLNSAELFLYQFLDMEYWVHYIALWLGEGKEINNFRTGPTK